jgi:hypothetical protein
MLKVAELALDAAAAAVVTGRAAGGTATAAGGTEIAAGGTATADGVGDVAAKAGTDIAAPAASAPAPTVTSRNTVARDARFRIRPRRPGLPRLWLVAALSLFTCTIASFCWRIVDLSNTYTSGVLGSVHVVFRRVGQRIS